MRETVRDLDIIATASDPQALVDHFCALPWVVEVAAKGGTKATVVSNDGLRYDLRVVPPESLRQPAAALHRLEGSQRRAARGRGAPRLLGLRVLDHRCRVGDEHRFATEEEVYAFLGYDWIPPELREDGGELAAARGGTSCRSSSRSATCAATCTPTPTGRTARTRSGRWSRRRSAAATRTTRSATTRTGCATAGSQQQAAAIDALNERVAPVPDPQGHRGEHQGGRLARRHPTRISRRSTGSSPRCTRLRQEPDRARPRRNGEPVRRLHRPRDRPQDRQTAAVDDRRRAGDRGCARRPARSSRSTRSPTGSISPTSTRAPHVRRGSSS